jgi:dihydroneopterin aldolase
MRLEISVSDRIVVSGIRAYGYHGVFDFENENGQDFIVDLVLELDLSQAGISDELTKTIDYGLVVSDVVAIVTGPKVKLIETLAENIANKCLSYGQINAVEVTVQKPNAPFESEVRSVAVTIQRSRT